MDIFYTRCLTDVVHLNHPETSQRRFAPTPDHFTGIRTSREIAEYKTHRFFPAWINLQPRGNVDPVGNQTPARAGGIPATARPADTNPAMRP